MHPVSGAGTPPPQSPATTSPSAQPQENARPMPADVHMVHQPAGMHRMPSSPTSAIQEPPTLPMSTNVREVEAFPYQPPFLCAPGASTTMWSGDAPASAGGSNVSPPTCAQWRQMLTGSSAREVSRLRARLVEAERKTVETGRSIRTLGQQLRFVQQELAVASMVSDAAKTDPSMVYTECDHSKIQAQRYEALLPQVSACVLNLETQLAGVLEETAKLEGMVRVLVAQDLLPQLSGDLDADFRQT